MDFGVSIAADITDIDYAVMAEQLGFGHLWVADSQMLWSDCYAVMALIASRTERIQIGTGVAVAGLRAASVTAAAHATINRLAPGRVFCGVGTGNTAMRIMGHRPIPVSEFDRHLGELRSLLDGDETLVHWRGKSALTRHLMPDTGFVAFAPRIPLYVSAFGPKAMAVAASRGDGLVASLPPRPEAVHAAWNRLHDGATTAGRKIDRNSFSISSVAMMVVLERGERTDCARAIEQAGAFAAASLHYLYEQWVQFGRRPPAYVEDIWPEYVAALSEVSEERRHLRIHLGHNCWVVPEEERFITPDLLEATCMIGTAEQLAARVRSLESAGLSQIVVLPSLETKEQVLHEVATKVMPLLDHSTNPG